MGKSWHLDSEKSGGEFLRIKNLIWEIQGKMRDSVWFVGEKETVSWVKRIQADILKGEEVVRIKDERPIRFEPVCHGDNGGKKRDGTYALMLLQRRLAEGVLANVIQPTLYNPASKCLKLHGFLQWKRSTNLILKDLLKSLSLSKIIKFGVYACVQLKMKDLSSHL